MTSPNPDQIPQVGEELIIEGEDSNKPAKVSLPDGKDEIKSGEHEGGSGGSVESDVEILGFRIDEDGIFKREFGSGEDKDEDGSFELFSTPVPSIALFEGEDRSCGRECGICDGKDDGFEDKEGNGENAVKILDFHIVVEDEIFKREVRSGEGKDGSFKILQDATPVQLLAPFEGKDRSCRRECGICDGKDDDFEDKSGNRKSAVKILGYRLVVEGGIFKREVGSGEDKDGSFEQFSTPDQSITLFKGEDRSYGRECGICDGKDDGFENKCGIDEGEEGSDEGENLNYKTEDGIGEGEGGRGEGKDGSGDDKNGSWDVECESSEADDDVYILKYKLVRDEGEGSADEDQDGSESVEEYENSEYLTRFREALIKTSDDEDDEGDEEDEEDEEDDDEADYQDYENNYEYGESDYPLGDHYYPRYEDTDDEEGNLEIHFLPDIPYSNDSDELEVPNYDAGFMAMPQEHLAEWDEDEDGDIPYLYNLQLQDEVLMGQEFQPLPGFFILLDLLAPIEDYEFAPAYQPTSRGL